MFQKDDIDELKKLKTKINMQKIHVKDVQHDLEGQIDTVDESPSTNRILTDLVMKMTNFEEVEINEIIKMELSFPGTIEAGLIYARRDFMREPHFDDFVYASKKIALEQLKDTVAIEQINLLSSVSFNTMTCDWGEVKEYNESNLVLLPREVQDLFAKYVCSGLSEDKLIFEENAKIAYSNFMNESKI